ncbi:MAG: peptide ABC transporter substrate-binding protein [Chlamydiales bacterium]
MLNLNFQEGDLPSIHPHHLEDHLRGGVLALLLYEGLTCIDKKGKVELAGARELHISEDQTLYTFTLHPREWSDGTPLTAYHYEKAWKQAIAPNSDCPRAGLFYIIKNGIEAKKAEVSLDQFGVHAIDNHTLQVELNFPAPYFLRLLTEPIFLPVLRDEKDPKYFNGPFLIKEWIRGERLTLEPNSHFWDAKQISLSKINISFVSDPNTVLSMYEKKAIDFIGEPLCRLSNEAVIHLQEKGVLKTQYPARFFWVFFNTEKTPFHNSKIRQAFSTAVSRQLITNHILAGDIPLYTLFPDGLSRAKEKIVDADPKKARALFEEGLQELGLTRTTFPAITLSYFLHVPGFKPLAEYFQEVWEQAFQIPVSLEGTEWNVYFTLLQKGQFSVGGYTDEARYQDPIEFLQRFEHKDEVNISNWTSPKLNEKILKIRQSTNFEEREHLLKEAEEMVLQAMPIIPICTHVHFYTHSENLKGIKLNPTGAIDFSRAYFSSKVPA